MLTFSRALADSVTDVLLKTSNGEVLISLKINRTYIAKSPLCAWKVDIIVFFSSNFSNLEGSYILSTVVFFSNKNNQKQMQLLYCCYLRVLNPTCSNSSHCFIFASN